MTGIQEYSDLYIMKTTIDVPDDLYRRVKAKSAMEAQTVREVTVSLYRSWLATPTQEAAIPLHRAESVAPAWFGAAKRYALSVDKHDMASIRESIARGRT